MNIFSPKKSSNMTLLDGKIPYNCIIIKVQRSKYFTTYIYWLYIFVVACVLDSCRQQFWSIECYDITFGVLATGGATLNSHWSVEEGCCVQYLYCETCHRGGDQCHLVGAQVRAVTAKTNACTKIGQVCVTTDSCDMSCDLSAFCPIFWFHRSWS